MEEIEKILRVISKKFPKISSRVLLRCAPKVLPNTPSGVRPMDPLRLNPSIVSKNFWKKFSMVLSETLSESVYTKNNS